MNIPIFQPNTALADIYGYALYNHEGQPWIVHTYKTRERGDDGVKRSVTRVEHLKLDSDEAWGDTKTAAIVRTELRKVWAEYQEWNSAMEESP